VLEMPLHPDDLECPRPHTGDGQTGVGIGNEMRFLDQFDRIVIEARATGGPTAIDTDQFTERRDVFWRSRKQRQFEDPRHARAQRNTFAQKAFMSSHD